jgi:hypothetical protein
MAQFDVYQHPLEELRTTHPYVVQVQSHFLKRPVAVMVIPLAPMDTQRNATVLNPILEVAGQAFLLETLAIGSFEPGELRSPLTNLGQDAQTIWDALDYALHGY